MAKHKKGGFTLPGEAGFEALTLALADRWGADVIRDSDGTALSHELLNAGYDIYSTICVIREHNDFAKKNPHCRQQTILSTPPLVQLEDILSIPLMDSFFAEQFELNDSEESQKYWQVFDRTSNCQVHDFEYKDGILTIHGTPYHRYTVNFFAYRIWEEISMYNHTTNHWDKEHLMQIDPIQTDTMTYLTQWMEHWCQTHPQTNVVRFTSLFYNFVWIWGCSDKNRHLFTDWSSYDFTVSPEAFRQFEAHYGYSMTLEDFINKGLRRSGHTVPDAKKRDWMTFIGDSVIAYAKVLIDIVHRYNKKAYVFYDDSWVGLEPYSGKFEQFQFDGIIKCVFSGFEVRLCADVPCQTHEIRLHPYLFPVGLGGLPTFAPGGNPTQDAQKYWGHVRRALLRKPIDRIGLGGYLHLTNDYPDFVDYVETLADSFRAIRDLHQKESPYVLKPRIAILTAFGALRSWTLSGHFHETEQHTLIHVLESLSGLPLEVCFLSFTDIANGIPSDIDVLLSAGDKGTAWSGGDCWADDKAVDALTAFVASGGSVIGIGEPSALDGYDTALRLSHLFGIDIDDGRYHCHGQWQYDLAFVPNLIPSNATILPRRDVRLVHGEAAVLFEANGIPQLTCHSFGKGKGIYLSDFRYTLYNTRMLLNLILFAANEPLSQPYLCSNPATECAYFSHSNTLMVINNSDEVQKTSVQTSSKCLEITLEPLGSYSCTI